MSIVVPADLAAAIESGERTPLVRVMVDWDLDGYGPAGSLDDLTGKQGTITVDRALITDLPAQVRLVEGTAAATGTVQLSEGDPTDETMHAARYFTRGSDSALGNKERNGRPCTVDIGFITASGPQYVRRLTGLTRKMITAARGRTASMNLLDNRARLRNTVTLIPTDGTAAGADGNWVVHQALYANGIPAGPVPRASGLLLWVPMYGSVRMLITNVGAITSSGAQFVTPTAGVFNPRFRAGPFVEAADPYYRSATDYSEAIARTNSNAAAGWTGPIWSGRNGRLEMWVLGVQSPTFGITAEARNHIIIGGVAQSGIGPGKQVRVGLRHDGFMYLRTGDTSGATVHLIIGTVPVPGDGAWHAVGVHFDHVAGTVTFKVDNSYETFTTGIIDFNELPVNCLTTDQFHWAPVSDVMLHDIPSTTPWLSDSITIGAILDRSALTLQASYEAAPREAWDLIGEVAAAEQAVASFDELGVFRYRNRSRLTDAAGQTVARALTTADVSLLDVEVDDGVDQVRNIIQVSYNPVRVASVGLVYSDTAQFLMLPGGTIDVPVSFTNRVLSLVIPVNTVTVAAAVAGPSTPYVAVTTNSDYTDDAGASLPYIGAARLTVVSSTPTGATLRYTNTAAIPLYVAATGLRGVAAVVGNTVVAEARNQTSITANGPQPLQITLPQWVQTAGVAQSLAGTLLGDLKDPHPQVTGLRIVGDPRRQLGDRVSLADPDGTRLAGEYWLTQIGDAVGPDGDYTQTVSARAATTVMRWGIGRWGIDTWS